MVLSKFTFGSDPFVIFVRCYRSAYRLKPGSFASNKLDINKEDEELYQEKVDNAMLHKQRSPLRLFDGRAANLRHLKKSFPSPNAPYYGRDDLPTYGSYQNYVKEAERARRKQRNQKLPFRTMTHWWKDHLLKINVDEYVDERDASFQGAIDGYKLAMHYQIYADLFGHAYFHPLVHMNVNYEIDNENVNPVYYGNEIQPSEAATPPKVMFESDPDQLWSLILTNPDGNLEDNNAEYLHWFVGNIKGSDISTGQTVVDYMQPIPVRGTGYHRMVFLLFKQDKELDFSAEERNSPCLLLRDRDFKTRSFYRKHKDNLIPVSLRFLQTKWEPSVQEFYQRTLDMAEPVYDFKPTKVDRSAPLKLWPYRKSIDWLKKFMPKEPIYPGGGRFL